MKSKINIILFAFFLGLIGFTSACHSELDSKPPSNTNTETKADLSFLKEGMAYIDARKLLIEHGWEPFDFGVKDQSVIVPACLKRLNTGCEITDSTEFCKSEIELCTTWPEIQMMSADGYCLMIMKNDKGKEVFITSYGSTDIVHREHEPAITGWQFSKWKPNLIH